MCPAVLSRYGVQLVLSGHEHGYELQQPTNGVHAITTAGGGSPLYALPELDVHALFWPRYNCVKVAIDGDTLQARHWSGRGSIRLDDHPTTASFAQVVSVNLAYPGHGQRPGQ